MAQRDVARKDGRLEGCPDRIDVLVSGIPQRTACGNQHCRGGDEAAAVARHSALLSAVAERDQLGYNLDSLKLPLDL